MNIFFIPIIFISFLIVKISIPYFEKNLLAIPNSRSSHHIPKPQGGGLVFASLGVFISILISNVIPLIAFPLSIVGFADDKFKLPSGLRFAFQMATILALANLKLFKNILLFENNFYILVLIIILVLFGTTIINFVNFMDGIDGLVISTFSLIFLIISLIYQSNFLFFTASLIGFIPFNWYPSKIFMGDAGSTFIGAVYVGAIFNCNNIFESINVLILSFPLLADAFFCLIRRFRMKDNIFSSHNLHLYQRLNQSGLNHEKVSLIYLLAVSFIGISVYLNSIFLKILVIVIELGIGFWLDKNIAVPFKIKKWN